MRPADSVASTACHSARFMSSWSPANGPPRYGDGVSSDAVLVLIGDVAALLAAGAALVALVYARETVGEAKAARQDADRAARDAAADRHRAAEDAAADRREAEYARTIRRVERVGEIVEDLFWSAGVGALTGGHGPSRWMADRNRLGVALVGLSERLPNCGTGTPRCGSRAFPRSRRARLSGSRIWTRRRSRSNPGIKRRSAQAICCGPAHSAGYSCPA